MSTMVVDHERLDVYQLCLDFMAFGNGVVEGLPRGRSHLADQLTRASLSILLNIAEGAGKHSKPDRRRDYVTARGSATESAALLDVCARLTLLSESRHKAGKEMLVNASTSARCSSGSICRRRPVTVNRLRSQAGA